MMKLNLLLCCCVFAAVLGNARALSKEEFEKIHGDLIVHVKKCSELFGVSDDEIKAAKEKGDVDAIDPCLIGCVFKSTKLVNEKGLYDPEIAVEKSDKFLSKEEDKAMFKGIAEECAEVNDVKVTDGEDGCERSKLLLACFGKHKKDLVLESRR